LLTAIPENAAKAEIASIVPIFAFAVSPATGDFVFIIVAWFWLIDLAGIVAMVPKRVTSQLQILEWTF